MRKAYDDAVKRNRDCSAANKNTQAKYVGTLANVQDMMRFTELQASLRGKDPKKALINYYGISYGTLMGQTLVATYPDRLRRVLVDGNVYGVAHYQGWEPSGDDDLAHGIWIFAKSCFEAGEKLCGLAKGAKSIADVQNTFDSVVEQLAKNPITEEGVKIDNVAFMRAVGQMMYAPKDATKGYRSIVNTTMMVMNQQSGAHKMMKREAAADAGSALGIITGVDIAGRYPWTSYETWYKAAQALQKAAPYGGAQYASSNG